MIYHNAYSVRWYYAVPFIVKANLNILPVDVVMQHRACCGALPKMVHALVLTNVGDLEFSYTCPK